jgi:hypothetical protein
MAIRVYLASDQRHVILLQPPFFNRLGSIPSVISKVYQQDLLIGFNPGLDENDGQRLALSIAEEIELHGDTVSKSCRRTFNSSLFFITPALQ